MNNAINLSPFNSLLPTYLKDPRWSNFSPIIKSKTFYEDLSKETVLVDGKSITIHNFLLEYYDLKVKEKDSRKKKPPMTFC